MKPGFSFNYLPRNSEAIATRTPTKPSPKIINPSGTGAGLAVASVNKGSSTGGASVNVANPVAVTAGTNAACKVGSIVGVAAEVGVDGAATIGMACEESVTFAAKTQPIPPGTPEYLI